MPLRVEVRSLEPYVVQIHNLLSENQTDLLRQIAEPKVNKYINNRFVKNRLYLSFLTKTKKNNIHIHIYISPYLQLSRSMVQAGKGSEVVSVSRTSQNAWVGPDDHPLMAKIYRLVQAVTGLSTDVDSGHAEIVQVSFQRYNF